MQNEDPFTHGSLIKHALDQKTIPVWYDSCLIFYLMETPSYSQHSFYSFSKQLKPVGPLSRFDLLIRANRVNERINTFIEEKDFPYVNQAQIGTYRVGIYGELGRGTDADVLTHDLSCFLLEQRKNANTTNSFWAVFYDTPDLNDEQFKQRVQWELSSVSAVLRKNRSIDSSVALVENDKSICLHVGDADVFIESLHRHSARQSNRFHYATLVFSTAEPLYPCRNH